eukprot:SM000062S19883  [mRNA]  locus=s62:166492:173377:- [translate_table: standard]
MPQLSSSGPMAGVATAAGAAAAEVDRKQYPTTAAEYRLLESVGQGVSATVYKALCIPLGNEVVAVKCLDLERCSGTLEEVRKETQVMSLLQYPNLVRAHCSFAVGQFLWVVMPFCAGGSCLSIMKSAFPDGFEEAVIATVLKDTLKGLEYLHKHGHIHRDVKAGNILIDSMGNVKLADYGVSAGMFDAGDRQRARNTFVGTPCWMAPEVMEQLHGYDFKADIWSFGITGLELAHGHAPFSKYPPMKVLLMTLQNAPPGLDLERDKRFSKSFKEMIAMCLVKDPTKRPSAEKLLKHSFFKHSKGPEYLTRNVLEGLAPLAERVKALQAKDEARLAAKKVALSEQEEISQALSPTLPKFAPQNEYKRGVSSWNFNVEDLKTQAALMDDDDKFTKIEEGDESAALRSSSRREPDRSAMTASTSSQNLGLEVCDEPIETGHCDKRRGCVQVLNLSLFLSQSLAMQGKQSAAVAITRKEPKHIGRFDVFEDDTGESPPEWKAQEAAQMMERQGSDREREVEREREQEREKAREKQKSGPLDPSRSFSGPRPQSRSSEGDQERSARPSTIDRSASEHKLVEEGGQQGTALPGMEKLAALQNKDRDSRRSFSGPLNSAAAPAEKRASNGGQAPPVHSASKDGEDRSKGAGAPVVQRKGRFSVTSESMDMNQDASGRKGGAQGSATTSPHLSSSTVPVAAIMPHLQTLMQHASAQQELVFTLMSNLSSGDNPTGLRGVNAPSRDRLRSASVPASQEYLNDMQTMDCERELMLQVTDLQARNSALMEELQNLKLRNIQMERQLNAYFNKEEEARIRLEEAAREDNSR